MIAVDWSHTKELTSYDGKKVRTETQASLIEKLKKDKGTTEGESIIREQSKNKLHPSVVLERGCPMSLLYNLAKAGVSVSLIDNKATEQYRKKHGISKSDENDAKIIWELANKGEKLSPVTMDDKIIKLHDLYHQYCRYQKARVAMENMRKAHIRHFGERESTESSELSSDLSPYDDSIDTLKAREKSLLKELNRLAPVFPKTLPIKGLGARIWMGIMVTADPLNFKCLSSYLRFCGLTSDVMDSHKYNRHAKMLYHMLSEQTLRQKNAEFRSIYDKCKEDIIKKYPDYPKIHVHNAALNRTATFLAKRIYQYRKETGNVFVV
jgi:hypothetical protein